MHSKVMLSAVVVLTLGSVFGGPWYWPFGSDEEKPKRISELMEKSSALIDEASDLTVDGKYAEAVEKYRAALTEIEKVERENPERAATTEFATVRNKRAYVNAAIDSILLEQARVNAKVVAVCDTASLEEKLAKRREDEAKARAAVKDPKKRNAAQLNSGVKPPPLEKQIDAYMKDERDRNKAVERNAKKVRTERAIMERLEDLDSDSREARLLRAGLALQRGKMKAVRKEVEALLKEDGDDASALNILAICEGAEGKVADAERTLERAIRAQPKDFHAYYNMANLLLQTESDKSRAKKYYERGRKVGGPEDAFLEEAFEPEDSKK